MGRDAYALNPVFRARFDETDALFRPLAGWSLKDERPAGERPEQGVGLVEAGAEDRVEGVGVPAHPGPLALFADDLEARLALTSVSQPLIFAIEAASTAALKASVSSKRARKTGLRA
jgi:phthiocerol/phenolphthiocerol synthesis type-I polyketide synthase C